MNLKKKMKKYRFETICSDCGMPITKDQLGLAIPETLLADYDERQDAIISINFCVDCWKRIKTHNKGGMEKAIRRFEKAQEVEQTMRDAYERRNGE